MAFSLGDRSTRSTINVTPLIDVLLVLLIIFMVIQPSVLQGISALTPSASSSSAASESPSLVINVENAAAAPAYRIDGQAFDSRELAGALQEQIQQRGRRTVFIVGSAALDYAPVALAVNSAKAQGAETIVLLTDHKRGDS